MKIELNKTYDFDNLSDSDFTDLIEEKLKKEKEKKVTHDVSADEAADFLKKYAKKKK